MITAEGPLPGTSRIGSVIGPSGYLEQEYLLHGVADLYAHDDDWNIELVSGDVPYVTRVLIRRPSDPSAATGAVAIEPLHPDGDHAASWSRLGRMMVREGWSWVGVTCHPASLTVARRANPQRYGLLDIPFDALGFEIVGEVAGWLRSGAVPSLALDHLFMVGSGRTGAFQRVFLGDGFHHRSRRPGNHVSIDGFLLMLSSGGRERAGYASLHPHRPAVPIDDRRRIVASSDAPVIELMSESEAETNHSTRRADSDRPDDRYRLYEVAGAGHLGASEQRTLDGPPAIAEEPSDFPFYALAGAALLNLWRWVVEGTTPPRAERIELLADRADGPCGRAPEALPIARDAYGNALGGVRTPNLELPVATYSPHSTLARPDERWRDGDLFGSMRRFDVDELRSLYGSAAAYLNEYEDAVGALVDGRWVLPSDAQRMITSMSRLQF